MSFPAAKTDPGQPLEEERLPWYNPDQFYPVRIGEILDSSYKVLGKLGYGAYSTVWLCRNIRDAGFVAIKFYEHISSLSSQHHGQFFIRGLLGTFEITGPTDINPSNIMLTVDDESVLDDFERAETEEPSPTKVINDIRIIYSSRKLGLPRDSLWGQPVLCDFGEARIGESHRGLIQPELYRAPEVLFDMEWSSSVDIWNVAALIWDLFENRHLFNAVDENLEPSATHHVAEMVAYLGLPPLQYIPRSEITKKVFNEQGRWKGAGGTVVPQLSLEESVSALDGETKEQFLNFIRSMLKWLPEKRKQASELLKDPWMARAIP
ncbi:kinase-like protein [Trematosphaeria pertusa]|uniref:Kinase-like protein n=1 Tax=Trematosphaeria pertusa TaxID=390896 RepID=A0A6A6HYV9_9PLEO|nr:kinase-like protein [Trematosphaeria pertusa]KAF2243251.1 kinase-like protein [Trematosphaeria pertusa]